MKVDLGTCSACGAKNSKFVQACYKCGAALPWAPDYVAPKSQTPQNTSVTPQPTPATPAQPKVQPSSPSNNDVKTVVSTPLDFTDSGNEKDSKIQLPASVSQRVAIPAWAIGAGVLGCVALGMILVMTFGNRNSPAPAPQPAVVPASTPAPTVAATPSATVAPTAATIATAIPTAVSTAAAPVATAPAAALPVVPPAPAVRVGPAFDEVDKKMDDRSAALTEAQKQTYWQTVTGTTIRWTGTVVEARLAGGGQLSLRCGKQTTTSDVTVDLDGTQSSMTGQLSKGEVVTISGILQDHTSSGYSISKGRIEGRG